jgi:hypothetical protein
MGIAIKVLHSYSLTVNEMPEKKTVHETEENPFSLFTTQDKIHAFSHSLCTLRAGQTVVIGFHTNAVSENEEREVKCLSSDTICALMQNSSHALLMSSSCVDGRRIEHIGKLSQSSIHSQVMERHHGEEHESSHHRDSLFTCFFLSCMRVEIETPWGCDRGNLRNLSDT